MVGVGGGERGLASTGIVWGSGGQVRDAQPATEGAYKDRVGHGEGGCSCEGLQEGRGRSAADAMLLLLLYY
jgi:hypothetical protein